MEYLIGHRCTVAVRVVSGKKRFYWPVRVFESKFLDTGCNYVSYMEELIEL